ncbi:D-tyrosyl-tRNA(Tyr) deacylase [candidate division BRC1 bacterium HGW-BRC1-1]|jgi:D-tyrosyl-tRNA(Tyr) deacylase|nr:MAG: D-tyrosyl-tRNA(Tyr) deacylase [candidate division BRC1 bacterium HGW-BRC1-1]
MKVVLQRVSEASVTVGEQTTGTIGHGLVALVGIAHGDDDFTLTTMATKVTNLRIFEDDDGKMNRSIMDVGGAILAVSQFTLFADCRKGRRPSFLGAAPPGDASVLFDCFVEKLRATGTIVETGIFQAMMDVRLTNHGPVTIILDSNDWPRS